MILTAFKTIKNVYFYRMKITPYRSPLCKNAIVVTDDFRLDIIKSFY